MTINEILEKAPAKISEYCEKENMFYAEMIKLHEKHKQHRAVEYLKKRAEGTFKTISELEAYLDMDKELNALKSAEIEAEINYRAWRLKKNNAQDVFQAAMERGRNQRAELKSIGDTIS